MSYWLIYLKQTPACSLLPTSLTIRHSFFFFWSKLPYLCCSAYLGETLSLLVCRCATRFRSQESPAAHLCMCWGYQVSAQVLLHTCKDCNREASFPIFCTCVAFPWPMRRYTRWIQMSGRACGSVLRMHHNGGASKGRSYLSTWIEVPLYPGGSVWYPD